MKFAQRLKELRESVDVTQAALAERSGIPIGTIRGYEQDNRAPLFATVMKICTVLGVDCTAFADCEDVAGEEKPPAKRKAGKK